MKYKALVTGGVIPSEEKETMADPKWRDHQILTEKMSAYLESHLKITADFERSLSNSRHYVELAELAKDKEPGETVTMLEQIQEIDLLGHLQSQMEAFEEVSSLLNTGGDSEGEGLESGVLEEGGPEGIGQMQELRDRYDLMLEEAEEQQEAIAELMLYLRNMA